MIVEKYSTINSSVQFAAAVYFKNYIKRKWKQVEGETDEIQKEDRGNNVWMSAVKEESLAVKIPDT